MEKFYRHGDVFLRNIDGEELEGLTLAEEKPLHEFVLAYGEVTGHRHVATTEGTGLQIYHDAQGRSYLKVNTPATITHEEHKPLTVAPGLYRIDKEREFDYFEKEQRQVID